MGNTEDELRRVLAENIRLLRLAKGWTQEELAHHACFHRTYVGSVERAERNVTLGTLCTLALALDTTVVSLLKPRAPDDN